MCETLIKRQIRYLRGPLIRLVHRLKLFVHKRSYNLQLLLLEKITYQLRLLDPDFHSEGFDKHFDKIIHIAALHMFYPEAFDIETHQFQFQGYPENLTKQYISIVQEYEQHRIEVDELVNKALSDFHIRSTIAEYFTVKSFTAIQKRDETASGYYLSIAKKYDTNASMIDVKSFFSIYDNTRKEVKSLRNHISDREAFKVSFSLKDVGALVSIASAFFLITGYLYNNFLLGHFGVEVSKYFSLSDYLASSIEGIRYSASGALIGLMSCFLGFHSGSRKSYAQLEIEKNQKDYWPLLTLAAMTAMAVRLYVIDSENFYSVAYLNILYLTFIISPWISRRYFKEPVIALFVIIFVSSFSAHMYESVGRQIYSIEHGDVNEKMQYEILFKNPVPFDTSRTILITANSNYLFLRDYKKEVYIVPRDQIEYVLIERNKRKVPQAVP